MKQKTENNTVEVSKFQNKEQTVVKRSSINFAPYNPRSISDSALNELKKNIKKRSLLGGIVVNFNTMNIVSGHQRIKALDSLHKYEGTPETDYNIIVEVTHLDEKEEKEQNIFMNSTTVQGEFDVEKLAVLLPDIDYESAGLSDYDINLIIAEAPQINLGDVTEIQSDIKEMEKPYEERKAAIKEAKEAQKEKAHENFDQDPFFSVAFDNYENKAEFLGMFGMDPDQKFIKGEILFDNIMKKDK